MLQTNVSANKNHETENHSFFLSHNKPTILVSSLKLQESWRITSLLEGEFDIVFAQSTDHVINLIENHRVDFLISTLSMKQNGSDCFNMLSLAREHDIPFVILTQEPNEIEEVNSFKLGALDYLPTNSSVTVNYARLKNHICRLRRQKDSAENIYIDPLTNIINKRGFVHHLSTEWQRAIRGQYPLSTLVLDIDCFKKINEVYGHNEGDNYLIEVASALSRVLKRGEDTIARTAGQEFSLLLPFVDCNGILAVTRTIMETVRSVTFPNNTDSTQHLTVSIGGATFYPIWNKKPNSDQAAFIDCAKQRLIDAKTKGGNRYCVNSFF